MGKTTVEQKKNKITVINKLMNPEAINERELNAIAGGLVDSLIPVATEMSKKGVIIKSSITGMVTLKDYFSGLVSKKMFLDVVSQIASALKECEKNLMNTRNLMLDWETIFVTPTTKTVTCIFWPIVNNQNPADPLEFFKELPFRLVFTKQEEHDYVTSYLRYFKNNPGPFSINHFEKMILEVMGKTVENKGHVPSGNISFGESSSLSNENKSSSIAYNPYDESKQEKMQVCSKCGNPCGEFARFCTICGAPFPSNEVMLDISEVLGIKSTQTFSETTVLGAEEMGEGGTTVLGAETEEPTIPYLIREKTQEKVIINKPNFKIGKEKQFCDYCVSDNNAVSRSHANIITREHRYYIIDNNSTNKTYVDERVIPAQKEVEIFSGTAIRLANEDFVFYI